ncbi:MAG: PcfK-like family protein [Tannerellaceae bacterium]|jgi:hypothetical protein|nr:PcfK-like family protein [Tannerellaceae bacterium]
MKSTDTFKKTIREYLDGRAKSDTLFATSYNKTGKNINDCCTYIINQVKESGCSGFSSDEIFGMAVHYYDEDDIKVGDEINCRIVVNTPVELTEEEKDSARKDAMRKYQEEQLAKLKDKQSKPRRRESVVAASLFDEL